MHSRRSGAITRDRRGRGAGRPKLRGEKPGVAHASRAQTRPRSGWELRLSSGGGGTVLRTAASSLGRTKARTTGPGHLWGACSLMVANQSERHLSPPPLWPRAVLRGERTRTAPQRDGPSSVSGPQSHRGRRCAQSRRHLPRSPPRFRDRVRAPGSDLGVGVGVGGTAGCARL